MAVRRINLVEFAEIWEDAQTIWEVAEKTGYHVTYLRFLAHRIRLQLKLAGCELTLKKFKSGPRPRNIAEVAELLRKRKEGGGA